MVIIQSVILTRNLWGSNDFPLNYEACHYDFEESLKIAPSFALPML